MSIIFIKKVLKLPYRSLRTHCQRAVPPYLLKILASFHTIALCITQSGFAFRLILPAFQPKGKLSVNS